MSLPLLCQRGFFLGGGSGNALEGLQWIGNFFIYKTIVDQMNMLQIQS
jgi:hypothetical protein